MENNFNLPINNLPTEKPSLWETNPKLKTLLVILIFVFLFSGIGLVAFAQWQNQYRQQIYNDTQAALPKHQVPSNADISGWKIYKNNQYGFEISYPPNYWISTTTQSNVGPDIESEYASIDFRTLQPSENSSNNLSINGISALEYPLGGNRDGGIDYGVYFSSKNLAFAFSTKKPGFESKLEEFKMISATIKFITPITVKPGWKYFSGNTVYGEQYTFSLQYPERWILGESRGGNALTYGQCIIAIGDGGGGMEGYPSPKIEMTIVDGIKATIQTWTNPGSKIVIVNTQVLKGNDDYIFDLTYNSEDTQCLADYKDILKTITINN